MILLRSRSWGSNLGSAEPRNPLSDICCDRKTADSAKSCALCQIAKHSTSQDPGLLIPIEVKEPWEMLTLDFISGLPSDEENKYTDCLVIVDKFTKWVIAALCRANPTSKETAELLLNHVIYAFGIPKVILSDRGTQFVSKI